ncbi:ornithine cyclodeaminase family protein [Trinickia terrae]|uniref:Ornithine cyclodeaminase family protein n=1 Tax=Trinickia terrae TaxID=2571161 RepID=A0A4U1IFC3_9BURK|nr:ornithine cyclodeaminase family protein [Trinickia terrae]TKC92265.1 ornithine cyclodeaminase family protein [Trinickia terrae]
MTSTPIWLTEQDVVELIQLPDAITALEHSLAAESAGQAGNMSKTMLQYGKSNLHALGGQLGSLVGTKSWTHAEAGTCPLLMLWDAYDGQLAAVIEAFALGNMRTGGTSGLAAKWMSSPDASVMAIIGCGKQALSQVASVVAVRPIAELRVFSRSADTREAFAAKVQRELGIRAVPAASVEAAADGADVVTLATRATEPVMYGRFLKPGAHVNAIGAIGLDREEFAQDLFDRAGAVCVDYLDGVKKQSREFTRRFADDSWDRVQTLGSVIAAGHCVWQPTRISIFKAMGMGLSDVALGAALVDRARRAGVGRPIEPPKKAAIRFRQGSGQTAYGAASSVT